MSLVRLLTFLSRLDRPSHLLPASRLLHDQPQADRRGLLDSLDFYLRRHFECESETRRSEDETRRRQLTRSLVLLPFSPFRLPYPYPCSSAHRSLPSHRLQLPDLRESFSGFRTDGSK